ncbi:hypothetical protein BDQ12DRAFT_126333 [Crucibulum laeve]|uniref:Uncharacterized protein n=1 Tax=Crucibulum laeve TaxID=68775 RepID=A0A5C3M0D9_9AGAR|nr:hypothetical protein BDQ12DRAFT_126333 [Crucibulum laeve]
MAAINKLLKCDEHPACCYLTPTFTNRITDSFSLLYDGRPPPLDYSVSSSSFPINSDNHGCYSIFTVTTILVSVIVSLAKTYRKPSVAGHQKNSDDKSTVSAQGSGETNSIFGSIPVSYSTIDRSTYF